MLPTPDSAHTFLTLHHPMGRQSIDELQTWPPTMGRSGKTCTLTTGMVASKSLMSSSTLLYMETNVRPS